MLRDALNLSSFYLSTRVGKTINKNKGGKNHTKGRTQVGASRNHVNIRPSRNSEKAARAQRGVAEVRWDLSEDKWRFEYNVMSA